MEDKRISEKESLELIARMIRETQDHTARYGNDVYCLQDSFFYAVISMQVKATVGNDSQMYKLKLHTLQSPLKKNGHIGIVEYFDTVKQENTKESGKKNE